MPFPLIPLVAAKVVIAGGMSIGGHRLALKAQRPEDYLSQNPTLDPMTHLQGPLECEGIHHNLLGRARWRATGTVEGFWETEGRGRLVESLSWNNAVVTTEWDLRLQKDGTVQAISSSGTIAKGKLMGNSLSLSYHALAPGGKTRMHVSDWFYMLENKHFIRRVQYSKIGYPMGETILALRPKA